MNRAYRQVAVPALASLLAWVVPPATVLAQEPPPIDHSHMNMGASPGWQLMQDGIFFTEFNHQGGPRGGNEFVAPNWWMGMASRKTSRGQFTFTSMLSLDAATVGNNGYREIFQAGEALNGRPIVDRQHPHDLFMQMAVVWRIPVTGATGLTLAAAPAGEPALGPVAFMHRASALDNPTAPLGHHTFDSTHVAFGVVTAAVDHGRWMLEGSVFNGREPDEHRWDFDLGRLDSIAGRLWFRPAADWELQVSTGHLKDPEALEPGNINRSTASVAWTHTSGPSLTAFSIGYGRNDTGHGARDAMFAEGAARRGRQTVYGRLEALQVETAVLLTDAVPGSTAADRRDSVVALTLGGVRDLPPLFGFEGGFGADVTLYGTPAALESAYGSHAASFHLFFRLRLPAGAMGRMWNMRMSQPMSGHL